MSLSSKDVGTLFNVFLSDRISRQSLESISQQFHKQFQKTEHFKICHVLIFLLDTDLLPEVVARCVALFLLLDVPKADCIKNNPFREFFARYFQNDELARKLPLSIIYVFYTILVRPEQMQEFSKCTPLQIANFPTNGTNMGSFDWAFLNSVPSAVDSLPRSSSCDVSCVLSDEDVTPSGDHDHCAAPGLLESVIATSLSGPFFRMGIKPELIRVAPPLLPCPQGNDSPKIEQEQTDTAVDSTASNEELIWLNPMTVEHEFYLDKHISDDDPTSELRGLIALGMNSPLSQQQQQTVVRAIDDNSTLVHNLGITPENVHNLITKNLVIMINIFPHLINSAQGSEYYNAIIEMEVTVNSLELVNRLTSEVQLPMEFICSYISKCIKSCQTMPRHVRIVCLLLQSLIRRKILELRTDNILVEVQKFCLDFSTIREANLLYSLIKTLESSKMKLQSASTNQNDS